MTNLTTQELAELEKNADLSLTRGVPYMMTTAELKSLIHAAREVEQIEHLKSEHSRVENIAMSFRHENDLLTRKLQAATKALEEILIKHNDENAYFVAQKALKTIEEMK